MSSCRSSDLAQTTGFKGMASDGVPRRVGVVGYGRLGESLTLWAPFPRPLSEAPKPCALHKHNFTHVFAPRLCLSTFHRLPPRGPLPLSWSPSCLSRPSDSLSSTQVFVCPLPAACVRVPLPHLCHSLPGSLSPSLWSLSPSLWSLYPSLWAPGPSLWAPGPLSLVSIPLLLSLPSSPQDSPLFLTC